MRDRQQQGHDHQRQRGLDPLRDHRADRQVGEDRDARGRRAGCPTPSPEPHEIRPVEPEAGADALDIRRRRLVAGDDGGRVAGAM
jgi:hypothetical protein